MIANTELDRIAARARAVSHDLIGAMVKTDLPAANTLIGELAGVGRLRVDVVDNRRTAEAAPVLRIHAPGAGLVRFHPLSWSRYPELIFGRFVATLPLLIAALPDMPAGWCSLNLGDSGHRPGLTFCDNRDAYTLVPDPVFLMTNAYSDLAAAFSRPFPWTERSPALFWRGALTGPRGTESVESLPRVQLCRWAQTAEMPTDIGLTDLLEAPATQREALFEDGLVRPYVATGQFDRYRFHVDIDGHSNSWPGLMAKLHSGGTVLKVESSGGYRQWYYDRLSPWVHYVPVRPDLGDLAARMEQLLQDDDLAQTIGRRGRDFARSLNIAAEIRRVIPAMASAIRRE